MLLDEFFMMSYSKQKEYEQKWADLKNKLDDTLDRYRMDDDQSKLTVGYFERIFKE